ncbi:Potassium/sodium hyperpolarization-activated cyclic nucleotide-gated channel 2 [Melipona quadrifasciata]|uniref:Potassium/sodium hyperpolarization-activated cyclic nucleotide-gated channel 2 n=1 Tax=Melipona quadrifasciata TaxID=166423 RepID=A0A0N0U645_9HYME|nr:Potassium/sodium hyperpolarization-activated cyclic nucleotide-gated channel 2 [Melipona quadrifasciata]
MILHADHICDIPDDDNDILFLSDRGRIQKIYDILRFSLLPSRKNPAAHKYLRSNASISQEKHRHWESYASIIHPFSMFRHYWDFLMIFVITTILIFVPYQSSFEMEHKSPMWHISKNFLLFICCMDIVVNFRTGQVSRAYFDNETHGTILEQRKIISRYMKSGTFFPDMLGSFPTDLFYLTTWVEYTMACKTTSLIFAWIILLLHWQTCFHWLIPIVTTSIRQPERPSNISWIEVADLWDAHKSQQYLASSLRAVVTFMRAGLRYTNQEDVGDIYMIIVFQLFGIVAPWFIITRVMQFFKGVNSSHLRYQSTVAQLRQYMRHKQLPHPTQKRIVRYYEFRYQHRFFRESQIINTLSVQMRHEIRMHSCRKLVENVTFFSNLPLTLLGRIVALLKSEVFLTNDVIVRANQPGDCMYFIATGTVAIYTNSGKEVCHLEDGAHFGEVALVMPNELRVASVVAVEVCELYRLNRGDFARTIHPYPMLWETIKKIAIERHEKTMILNEQ